MKVALRVVFLVYFASLLRESSGYAVSGSLPQQIRRNSLPIPILRSVARHGTSNFASFPDSSRIKLDESGLSSHSGEYRVDMASGDGPPPPEQLWNWWSEKRVQEDALKGAIAKGKTAAELRPVFDEYAKYLVQDKVEVLNANKQYFEALRSGDMGAMQALWLNSDSTICVTNTYFKGHPESANVIGGFANISNYYAKHTPTQLDYQLEDVNLLYYGEVAVVSCSVHARKPSPQPQKRANSRTKAPAVPSAPVLSYYVTNVFQRPFGRDRYFLHTHVSSLSPVPASRSGASSKGGSGDVVRRRRISAAQRATYKDPTRAVKAPSPPHPLEQLGRFFGRSKRGPSSESDADTDTGGYESDNENESESEEQGQEDGAVDDITGEYYEPSTEDEAEDPDESDGEYEDDDNDASDSGHMVMMTEDGLQAARRFAGNRGSSGGGGFSGNKKGKGFSSGGKSGIPSPAEEESQLRMNRLKDAIMRTLSSLAAQKGSAGMAGLRNGVLIVSSNGPTRIPPITSPNMASTSALASDATNPNSPLRALDAVMRGLPPSSIAGSGSAGNSKGADARGGSKHHSSGDSADQENDEDSESEERDQEQEQAVMKALAARSLEALRHLHATQQLTAEEKTVLSSDVIQCLSQGKYSQVEMAYALLILGTRPDESLLSEDLATLGSSDLSDASPEDTADLAAFCHSYAQQLAP